MSAPDPGVPERLALDLFGQGFTCSQAVLAAFAERQGLDQDEALRVAAAFGGGIARTGGMCGAVTGALMAIGLAHGRTRAEDTAARERTSEASRQLLERFRQQHGTVTCSDLLGVDMGSAEGRAAAAQAGLFRSRCPEFVRCAVRLVEPLL